MSVLAISFKVAIEVAEMTIILMVMVVVVVVIVVAEVVVTGE